MNFSSPITDKDFEDYFEFRWRILRQPQGLPKGSERDHLEDISFHLMVRSPDGKILGVSKFKPHSDSIAQISHVAVDESCRGTGIGSKMVQFLEDEARKQSYKEVFLTAREYNIPYFAKLGYILGDEHESPLPEIRIFKMHKLLTNGR